MTGLPRVPRAGRLLVWVVAADALAVALALAPVDAGQTAQTAGQAVRGFVAWCGIG